MSQIYDALEPVFEAYAEEIKQNKSDISELNASLIGIIFGGNLITFNTEDKVHNGITFTIEDGVVTANGTATGTAYINVGTFTPSISGEYFLSGAPTGGGIESFRNYIVGTNTFDIGSGALYYLTSGVEYTIRIIIYTGYVADNLTFAPNLIYKEYVSKRIQRVNGISSDTSITDIELGYGAWQSTGREGSASKTRVCSNLFYASGTFTVSLSDFSDYRFSVVQYPIDSNGSHIDSGWKTSAYTVTVDYEHYFALNFSKVDNSAIDDIGVFQPIINSDDGFYWHLSTIKDIKNENEKTSHLCPSQYYYDHIFIKDLNKSTEEIIIPSESLANIESSYRLGFNMIEANVKALSDGNYIVCHGGGTGALYFGTQFEHVDGTTDVSGIAFSDVDLAWVQENIRYRTSIDKYHTCPSTLQDFLYTCKSYNMTALVQCIDSSVAEIANKILGKNKWVGYNASRSMTDGLIMSVYSATSVKNALAKCYEYGKPYMLCLDNTISLSSDLMQEIIDAVHEHGFLIGYVQYFINERYNQEHRKMGFDFCASSWSVNRIESGNICNLSGDIDYGDFETTGEVSNGLVTMDVDDTLSPSIQLNSVFLGKGELNITFEGRLWVTIGEHINMVFNPPSVSISTYFLNEVPTFTIKAYTNATIKSISYKASKC